MLPFLSFWRSDIMTTTVYENTERGGTCRDFLSKFVPKERFRHLIILPIPTCRGRTRLLSGTDLDIDEALSLAGEGTLAVGYGIPRDAADGARARGCVVVDSASDEEFLRRNGELTALATVGILLTTEKRSPEELRVGVVGYGRIGKSLVRTLLYLGCPVKVFTSRPSVLLELASYGIDAEESLGCTSAAGLDVLINTAPAVLFDRDGLSYSPLRIIDLASGDSFPDIPGVERYPSLPARAFPESAGLAWGRSVLRTLEGGGS